MSKIKKNEVVERKLEAVCIPCPNPFILEIESNKPYFDKTEFSKFQLTKPYDQFNNQQANKFFLHTYVWRPEEKCCQVMKAHIQVKMTSLTAASSLTSGNAGNDTITIVHNGGVGIVGEKVFAGCSFPIPKGKEVIKNFVLTGSQLNWLNTNHKLSFFVQDDTSVNWIKIRLEVCCLNKIEKC